MKYALLVVILLSPTVAVAAEPDAKADWWSLRKLTRPEPPAVRRKDWVRNPIDAFVLAALEARGLQPAPAADKAALLRRVTFDLIGLPPTPEEIDAFLKEDSPGAYEKVVDRLLASPHYGERWARHWLDAARFSESQGFEYDRIRDHAWRYRDYVVQSFNEDKPYPQFVKEQIAGDVIEPIGPNGIIATAFLTAGPWDEAGNNSVSKPLKARIREEELEDIIGTVGQTFMGLTVNCARCHDHKFDPIQQKDYYRLKAVFEGVRYGNRPILTPDQSRQRDVDLARINKQIGEINGRLAVLEQIGRDKAGRDHPTPAVTEGLPKPLARWTFEVDAKDVIGGLHGTLMGGAVVENGRLKLNGKTAFLETAPLARSVREKTLEAWAAPANLDQRGGGVISLESKGAVAFDAVVFGERVVGRWMAGSENFRRTHDLEGPSETAKPGELVHVAVVYGADNTIAVYRNGESYAPPYVPTGDAAGLPTYPAGDSHLLFGLRHTGAGNGFFAGEIAEARLYDKALSASEVAASYKAGLGKVTAAQIVESLTPEQRREHDRLARELSKERDALKVLQSPPLAYCAVPSVPPPTFLLKRGDVDKPGEQVVAGGLSTIKQPTADFGLSADAPEGMRRLKLAEWMTSPDNPLPARVMVNRVWHYHFGRGIVASPNDFGFNGERPTHPELLDWLASEFIVRGWSVKKLHKLLVTSATYQQGSAYNAKAAEQDADDRYLWRFAPHRLEGEAVRDAMLSVSGQLNPQMGGPSFRPFTVTVFNSAFYTLTDSPDPEQNRRTLYRINVESAKSPLLEAFDCPDPSTKTPRRAVTTTPLQALALMNNSFVLRQARCFGDRVRKETGDDPESQVRRAYLLAFGRPPTKVEIDRAAPLAKKYGPETLGWVLLNSSEFLYLR
jgi:Protein of unknown function (DUF1553)/Protein of unknown function (DUF1549)/Concanavalin A-like lectin/glucanases superfamily